MFQILKKIRPKACPRFLLKAQILKKIYCVLHFYFVYPVGMFYSIQPNECAFSSYSAFQECLLMCPFIV
jgi:hypothetical protein